MLADPQPPKAPAAKPALVPGGRQTRQVDSATLLGPCGEVFIVHHEQVYRLRVTAQGKLILTK